MAFSDCIFTTEVWSVIGSTRTRQHLLQLLMVIGPLLLAFSGVVIVLLGGVWEHVSIRRISKYLLICIFLVYLLLFCNLLDKILQQLLHITVDLVLVDERSVARLVLDCCGSVLLLIMTY